MAMTVLEALVAAADEVGTSPPSAYTSDSQLLNLLYATCRDLRRSRAFPQQKRTHEITFTASREQYYLPQDFYAGLLATQYNQSDNWQLIGPLSDGEYNYRLYGPGVSSTRDAYRIFGPDANTNGAGGQFWINPLPASTDTISFEYVSASLFLPPNWAPSTAYVANQYVNANGNNYLCDTNGNSGATAPTGQTADISDGTTQWDYVATAYEKARSDNDLLLFDDDVVITGIRMRWYKAKRKLDQFAAEQQEYLSMINTARARWTGNYIASACQDHDIILLPRVPEQSWNI